MRGNFHGPGGKFVLDLMFMNFLVITINHKSKGSKPNKSAGTKEGRNRSFMVEEMLLK